MLIVGTIGSGKTSACMYPYVEQLLAYRAGDPAREVAGLVLEVKGDFLHAGARHPATPRAGRRLQQAPLQGQ